MSDADIPSIGAIGLLRWIWRQLTSMRTALFLLMLLAIAAIPGSLIPQRTQNPLRVQDFYVAHKQLAPIFDKLRLFDVYGSPWFSAVYLLLFISLVGCVLPRAFMHAKAMSARPPATPSNLSRLEHFVTWSTELDPTTALANARHLLKKKRFRLYEQNDSLSAEKGFLRETGNLIFHLSLVLLLVAMALGALQGCKGEAIVVEGETFIDSPTSYDNLTPGRFFNPANLPVFSIKVNQFIPVYDLVTGMPLDYTVKTTVTESGKSRSATIKVNHPLEFGSTNVYLQANGYAPVVTVKDGAGNIVLKGPVPFLPQDSNLTSIGAIKVPDALPTQLGFVGSFLPTAVMDKVRGGFSSFPDAFNPRLLLSAWTGDLGLDNGTPQSVYRLDTSKMTRIGLEGLSVGDTWTLPNGAGSISFDGWDRWVNLQVARDPGKGFALTGAILAIFGLMMSLFIRRRRIWVRVFSTDDGTRIEVGGLARSGAPGLEDEMKELVKALKEGAEQR
ncbi:MAG TPA: cytochrome c biogenesis protein ResB [Candidatus Nanopelagicaceae bacterium]|nr:cytochrome c biogenesis protein ResB [Candidatus Nanopelagicaceae bacterium]